MKGVPSECRLCWPMKPQAASWQGLACMARLSSGTGDTGVVQLTQPGAAPGSEGAPVSIKERVAEQAC